MDKCSEFLDDNGDSAGSVVIKSDQEPAIESLMNEVMGGRAEGKITVEESPKKSSGSNRVVERAVQEVEGALEGGVHRPPRKAGAEVGCERAGGRISARICDLSAQSLKGGGGWEDGV